MASARDRIAGFWDELTATWLDGEDPLPDPLPRWYASYEGRGEGKVIRDAFAEPYVGDGWSSPGSPGMPGRRAARTLFAFESGYSKRVRARGETLARTRRIVSDATTA